jgi:RHS repeat-associated protein
MDRAGQTYYYHPNALWSVAALTDGTGAVAERYTYDAYGLVTVLNASYAPLPLNPWGTPHSARTNAFRFTGREQDEEAGVYFYRGRHYDCDQGRFRQRDPIEETPGANLYQYVLGNPARWTDPSGLRIWTGTETVQWYFWDEWGWNFFNYYPAQWVRTGKTKVRLFVQTLDCCGLKWLKPEDISDRTWRGGHPGYWSKRDHSYAANATAEVAKQECDCVVNGVRRKVDGLKVTVAHRHSTEETAKITITGGVNAEVGAEGGKVGGQLGASIEFAPSKEGSWVKTYGLICPTGGADSRPRVTSLDPASDDSIHEYHSRDGAQWSGLSPSN